VNGDAITKGEGTSQSMTGKIIPFAQFFNMSEAEKLSSFDVILGTCIGKSEMDGRSVVL